MTYYTANDLKSVIADPKAIVKALDHYVVGQEAAKISLSLMLLRRSMVALQAEGHLPAYPLFDKSNVLINGPSGAGKTHLMRSLAIVNNSPIGIEDVTCLTSAGYVGGDVEEILERYVLQCEDWAVGNVSEFLPHLFSGDTHLTSVSAFDYQYETALEQLAMQCINNGIIYLDEIDKIRKSSGSGKDVGGEAVQNELLKVLENGMIHLWQNKRGNSKQSRMKICTVDTKNIVFVCGGAFEGLQEIVDRRLKKSSNIGFTSQQINVTTETTLLSLCTTEDLIEYGFKREFLGRLPLRTHLDKLTKHDLERIIVEPKDNLYSQYKLLFKLFDIDLKIDKKAIGFLAEKALETNTGARALKSIFTSLFTDSLYNLYHTDGTEIKVGLDFCKERL